MKELLWQIGLIKAFTVYTSAAMGLTAFFFFREIVDAPAMALLSLPTVIAGGVVATALFQYNQIILASDREANVAAMAGIGALVALLLMIAVKWIWTVVVERRVASIDLPPVAPRDRVR